MKPYKTNQTWYNLIKGKWNQLFEKEGYQKNIRGAVTKTDTFKSSDDFQKFKQSEIIANKIQCFIGNNMK